MTIVLVSGLKMNQVDEISFTNPVDGILARTPTATNVLE